VTPAAPQLAVNQASEQILLLPLRVDRAEDSVASVKTMDLARERLTSLARYKVVVVPKAKLCEALQASGFPCDGLLDEQQARQLARFLRVNAYTTGQLEANGDGLAARVRVLDIGSSGFATAVTVADPTTRTPEALAEAIAQRLNTLIRAGENARECTTQRQRGNLPRAMQAAQRAIAADSAAVSAYLCLILVSEAQRLAPDTLLALANRVIAIDSLNATGWDTRARIAQQVSDTTMWIGALQQLIAVEPYNIGRMLGTAQLLYQMKRYEESRAILDRGLSSNPGDQAMQELRTRVCIDGSLWRCALEGLTTAAGQDTTLPHDTTWIRVVIGAAQQVPDTQALVRWTTVAVQNFPGDASFLKAHGAALELGGMADSAITIYKQALQRDPTDLATGLLVAKSIVDNAAWDTTGVRGDTVRLSALRTAYGARMDSAKVYIDRALAAPDTTYRLSATVIMLTAGSKLAQAGAYGRAYAWLDETLRLGEPASPADTAGAKRQIRTQASFWFGLSAVQTLVPVYQAMVNSKSCTEAAAVNQRIQRTKQALIDGARVHPPTANSLLGNLQRFEDQMPRVKQAFRCTNF
jgi:tetratricopeptide (TPR) repeat protein